MCEDSMINVGFKVGNVSKVKKGIEMGHMTNLGEEWRDCLVRGPEEGGWSEQRDREEDDQKMRSDIRHLVFSLWQRSSAFGGVLKITKSSSFPI